MLGLVIAVVCGRLKEEEFGLAFLEGKFDTPKAPSLGLLLEDVSRFILSCKCGGRL